MCCGNVESQEEVLPSILELYKARLHCLAVLEAAALAFQKVLGSEVLSINLRGGPASLLFQIYCLLLLEQKDLGSVYVV